MNVINISLLQYVYLLNFVFLMMHETEAAYWKEWKVFNNSLSDRKGLTVFTLARIPICIPLLYGLINVGHISGQVISLIISGFLVVHFFLHLSARKSFNGFKWPISNFIQYGMLVLSVCQLSITILIFIS